MMSLGDEAVGPADSLGPPPTGNSGAMRASGLNHPGDASQFCDDGLSGLHGPQCSYFRYHRKMIAAIFSTDDL